MIVKIRRPNRLEVELDLTETVAYQALSSWDEVTFCLDQAEKVAPLLGDRILAGVVVREIRSKITRACLRQGEAIRLDRAVFMVSD